MFLMTSASFHRNNVFSKHSLLFKFLELMEIGTKILKL